jgi:cell division GTPase FtsZ
MEGSDDVYENSVIKVIGFGGTGLDLIHRMCRMGIEGVELVSADIDRQHPDAIQINRYHGAQEPYGETMAVIVMPAKRR